MPNDKQNYRIVNQRVRKCCNPGKRDKTQYTSKIDRFGKLSLQESGKVDLSAYINSFKDTVDLSVILNKFVNGDEAALNKKQGMYMDVTKLPTSYAEMLNIVHDGMTMFDGLPLEIKRKFNNNAYEYISKIGTDEWFDILEIEKPKPVEKKKSKKTKEVVTEPEVTTTNE